MGGYFRDQDAPDLANVLYYAKQERDDIGIRIASMVKRMGDLDFDIIWLSITMRSAGYIFHWIRQNFTMQERDLYLKNF